LRTTGKLDFKKLVKGLQKFDKAFFPRKQFETHNDIIMNGLQFILKI